ncbi:MAG: NifB/NifX family molybdenum-iron cluster-binding protein [Campylobacterota bacterium]|nr:NifB/NifX family molybdenum-iron cluster-binding protein [Campylobacterota bacterium]
MLAIPLDTENSTTISELYGQAPYFAILNMQVGNFKVVKNEVIGQGPKSAEFLNSLGATSTIFYHMGEGVYKSFEKKGMDVFSSDHSKDSIDSIFRKIRKSQCIKLDESNYKKLLDPGNGGSCKCGCENREKSE